MKKLALVTAFAALLIAASSHENTAQAGPYGTAGCGLGSMVFGDKPGFIQVLAATTNGLFGTQTFGITSGTSNCGGGAAGTVTAKAFVETNREILAKDIARGNGETISALSSIAGCQSPTQVGTALQANFRKLFPAAKATDKEISQNVVDFLRSNDDLQCKQLGA